MINKPVTLFFEPLSLEVKYQKVLKLQIAIFRLSAQQAKGNKRAVKMDKTDPVKFTNPQERITFNKTLSLLTTLPFNSEMQGYDSKDVDIEIALQIDGKKERMGKKINLKDILLAKSKTFKFTQQSPLITLIYRAQVKLQDEKMPADQPKKVEQQKKATKILRFDEDAPNTKQNVKQPRQLQNDQVRLQRNDKGRHKTVFFEPPQYQAKIIDNHSEQSQTAKIKKYKSLERAINISETQSKQSKTESRRNVDLETKIQQYKDKYQKLQSLYGVLQKNHQQLQKKIKQKDARIAQANHKNEQLEQRLQNQLKIFKKEKEDLKKQQIKSQNEMVSQLKQEIRSYQGQIQRLRKTAINYQQSTKHIASGSEHQIKALRQKLSHLEKQNIEYSKQVQIFQQSLNNKDEIINDLKAKIYALDKDNLQLQNKVKSFEVKINKNKEQYEQQLQELNNKIDEMKVDNKNFKIATLKDIKDDNTDYKKKAQSLQKQLEKKEQLLRKMTDMKKQNENQLNSQISNLKRQILSLKEAIDKLEKSKDQQESQSSDIQIKIQLQKLKKELDTCRKNQKALLIQKGKLQVSNRTLQDDIVKNKCAIANILNAVQQTGNEKLITEVYCLTQ